MGWIGTHDAPAASPRRVKLRPRVTEEGSAAWLGADETSSGETCSWPGHNHIQPPAQTSNGRLRERVGRVYLWHFSS